MRTDTFLQVTSIGLEAASRILLSDANTGGDGTAADVLAATREPNLVVDAFRLFDRDGDPSKLSLGELEPPAGAGGALRETISENSFTILGEALSASLADA